MRILIGGFTGRSSDFNYCTYVFYPWRLGILHTQVLRGAITEDDEGGNYWRWWGRQLLKMMREAITEDDEGGNYWRWWGRQLLKMMREAITEDDEGGNYWRWWWYVMLEISCRGSMNLLGGLRLFIEDTKGVYSFEFPKFKCTVPEDCFYHIKQ